MIIKAERMRTELDSDNDLWLIDFRDEDQGVRGRIEIPSKIVSMEDVKSFEIEILPRDSVKKDPLDYSGAMIVYNATNFRTKPLGTEKVYSFSAGGLMLRLFSTKAIKDFKTVLKGFIIIIR
ncbi:MAG: hypothetical protein JSW11_06230 [Candidatus Heimdallarchaeota archaeon]|nr:MAG: hypothetical protein JSW11_06230 [Candidatus Heimdallarchaeota archaeon]